MYLNPQFIHFTQQLGSKHVFFLLNGQQQLERFQHLTKSTKVNSILYKTVQDTYQDSNKSSLQAG